MRRLSYLTERQFDFSRLSPFDDFLLKPATAAPSATSAQTDKPASISSPEFVAPRLDTSIHDAGPAHDVFADVSAPTSSPQVVLNSTPNVSAGGGHGETPGAFMTPALNIAADAVLIFVT